MVTVLSGQEYAKLCGVVYRRFDVWAVETLRGGVGCGRREFRAVCRPVVALALMGECGLRVGEAALARWGAFRSLRDWSGWLLVPASAAKLGQARSVPVSVGLGEVLGRVRSMVGVRDDSAGGHGMLSLEEGDAAVSTRTLQRLVARLGREVLGRSLWPHVLRHTYATRMMRVCELRVVQELLGHRSVKSTQVYTHVSSEDLVEAAGKVRTAFEG